MFYKNRGFTLIEAIITIAVMSILAAVSIPSYHRMVMNNEVYSLSSELMNALRLAQSEAIRRGVRVALTPHTRSESQWLQGWIVFEDLASIGVKNTEEELIRSYSIDKFKSAVRTTKTSIVFLPNGSALRGSEVSDIFSICPANGEAVSYTVEIERSGNITGQKGALNCPS